MNEVYSQIETYITILRKGVMKELNNPEVHDLPPADPKKVAAFNIQMEQKAAQRRTENEAMVTAAFELLRITLSNLDKIATSLEVIATKGALPDG